MRPITPRPYEETKLRQSTAGITPIYVTFQPTNNTYVIQHYMSSGTEHLPRKKMRKHFHNSLMFGIQSSLYRPAAPSRGEASLKPGRGTASELREHPYFTAPAGPVGCRTDWRQMCVLWRAQRTQPNKACDYILNMYISGRLRVRLFRPQSTPSPLCCSCCCWLPVSR